MSSETDSGKTYVLRPGDRLVVQLSGPAMYTWTVPTAADIRVLRRASGSSGPAAAATFLAAGPGQTEVTATGNPNCYPRCLPPSRLFHVGVSVG